MRQHFQRCGYLRVIGLDASDLSGDRRGAGAILEELCEARRLTRCVGLEACDALSDAQKRNLLATRVTQLRAEEGGATRLGDAAKPREAELRELREELLDERTRIVEENRRIGVESAAALSSRALASPSEVAEEFASAGISLCVDERLRELRGARLEAIDGALKAFAAGDAGICARCAQPIAVRQLRVAPDARVCRACVRETWLPS